MKKTLTGLLVLAINFYFGAAVVGVGAAFYTYKRGPIADTIALGILVAVLLACVGYQLLRAAFSWWSPGEVVIGNVSKIDLLVQEKRFSISRIPAFLLLLLTLALPGNFLDGVGDGQVYDLAQVFTIALLYVGFYRGLDFFARPGFSATAMFAGSLLLSMMMARNAGEAGMAVAVFFLLLALLWFVAWLVYRRFIISPVVS